MGSPPGTAGGAGSRVSPGSPLPRDEPRAHAGRMSDAEDEPEESLLLDTGDRDGSTLNPFKPARLSAHEKNLIATFSCRDADCFLPRDRATVHGEIREKFGSEAAFDEFVRTHLPAVLERSKREYSSNLLNVASDALEKSFGM